MKSDIPILKTINHREDPMPAGPWIMKQHWDDLLFLHWPVPERDIRSFVPMEFEIDTFDGLAWVSIVPFQMNHIRFRGVPPIPLSTSLNELNVRTYVVRDGKKGVYFWSLDADHLIAVQIARWCFHLPYFHAATKFQKADQQISFTSHRKEANFSVTYQPTSDIYFSNKGELEYWLSERYCLFTTSNKSIYCGEIHHLPWPLQKAEFQILEDTLSRSHGLSLDPNVMPLAQYCHHLEVYLWPLKRLSVREI